MPQNLLGEPFPNGLSMLVIIVNVIKKDQSSAERELFTMQMPTSSPMGAIIYETGGIFNPSWLVTYIGVRQF